MSQREVDPYKHVPWVDSTGRVRNYPEPQHSLFEGPLDELRYRQFIEENLGDNHMRARGGGKSNAATALAAQADAKDKPKLVKDQPFWYKWLIIIPVMAIVAVIGAKLAGYGFAAIYYDLVETTAWATNHWHSLVPADWLRHPIRDVMFEKMPAFAALQIIVYNFAKHWPRKAPNRLDRVEGLLRIPNSRIDDQGIVPLLLSPIWLLLYSGVGFALIMTGLWLFGHPAAYPPGWEITLVGLAASFVFGRRIAKGVAYHVQRIIIRERREDGKTKPAWWMLWPLRWRFEWNRDHPETAIKSSRRWQHYRLQRFTHHATLVAVALIGVFLIGQGFVILYQAAHGPIAWDAYWNAIKYGVTAWL